MSKIAVVLSGNLLLVAIAFGLRTLGARNYSTGPNLGNLPGTVIFGLYFVIGVMAIRSMARLLKARSPDVPRLIVLLTTGMISLSVVLHDVRDSEKQKSVAVVWDVVAAIMLWSCAEPVAERRPFHSGIAVSVMGSLFFGRFVVGQSYLFEVASLKRGEVRPSAIDCWFGAGLLLISWICWLWHEETIASKSRHKPGRVGLGFVWPLAGALVYWTLSCAYGVVTELVPPLGWEHGSSKPNFFMMVFSIWIMVVLRWGVLHDREGIQVSECLLPLPKQ